MQVRTVTRGVLIREEHIETLKRLPNKTMDSVLGAAFRVCLGQKAMLSVKDPNGFLSAFVESIAISAIKFDERENTRRKNDAERKRKERNVSKDAQNLSMSEGHPNLSVGHPRTETDENGQKRTKTDGAGVRPKERKERKNIYTPISPKGICEDPLADVDFEGMMGAMGVDQAEVPGADAVPEGEDAPDPDADGKKADIEFGRTIAHLTMKHPNKTGTDSFPRSLRRYLKKNPGADLTEIVKSHIRWIESGVWDDEGGRYAPNLKNWLWGGDWKQSPPEKKAARREERPKEDASVFHAGASL